MPLAKREIGGARVTLPPLRLARFVLGENALLLRLSSTAVAKAFAKGAKVRAAAFAALSLVLVTLAKLWAFDYIGPATPFLLYFVSIIVATWFGGWWWGIAATLVSAAVGTILFLPWDPPDWHNGATAVRSIVFLVEGLAITWIVATRRSAEAAAHRAAADTHAALARLEGVLGAVMDGISVEDENHRLIYANEAAAKLFGFASVQELLALSPSEAAKRFELFDEKGDPLPIALLPGRMVLQGAAFAERLVRMKFVGSQTERWVLLRANPVQIEGNERGSAVNVFRDVTEQRAQAEAVRLHREWLSTTLGSIGDAVIATDGLGKVVFMNAVAEGLTGWRADQAVGTALGEIFVIVDENTRQPLPSPVEAVMQEGKVVGLSNAALLLSRGGKEIPIDDSAAPIRDRDGKLIGTVLVFRDVSARRDAERRNRFIAQATQELGSSLDYKQTLATVARLAVPAVADWCAVDLLEGDALTRVAVQHVDRQKIRFVYEIQKEYPPDPRSPGSAYEIVRTGKPLFLPAIPDDLLVAAAQDARHLALIRQLQLRAYIAVPLASNGAVVGVLTLAMAESGRNYDENDLELARGLADRSTLAVNHARLFAENLAARAAAERANRSKDEFLAMLGHELRNPLAPILTALQLMRLRTPGIRDREQEILERQVKHVVALVDDLLDVARITRGKIQHEEKPMDVAQAITRALEVTESLIHERQHQLVTDLQPGLTVSGDSVRLAQVFINLITNAAKYTPAGGKIFVTAKREGSQIVVRVSDNGAGITHDLLPQLFDLFVQGDQELDRSKGGLGLGLAIVRSLVQLHGGDVAVHSDGPKMGSEFTVTLPALINQTVSTDAADASGAVKSGGPKVLVVDDNHDALELLGEALQMVGYETFTASTPLGALELANKIRPHIGLLDIGLPDIDGYELAARMRALPGLQAIKLVALTGYGQPADVERSKSAGFDEHLVKPASLDRLREILERFTNGEGTSGSDA